jgi:hypothetical protein
VRDFYVRDFDKLGWSEGTLPLLPSTSTAGNMLLGDAAWFPNYGDYLALPGGGGYQAENVIKVGPNRYWGFVGSNKITSLQGWKKELRERYVEAGGSKRTDDIPGYESLSTRSLDVATIAMSVFELRNK